jgi:hypothetical protein
MHVNILTGYEVTENQTTFGLWSKIFFYNITFRFESFYLILLHKIVEFRTHFKNGGRPKVFSISNSKIN